MNEITTIEHEEIISTPSMAVSLQSAEIDQQVSTARAYPRSMKSVQNKILSMATMDEESAKECLYALPRGGKPIKGPSIRFAEVLKQAFGNCRSAARVIHVDRKEMFVEAEGVFHDLESNSASTARVRRRISDRNGKIFNDDMIIVTGNAACAIAMRNAILAGVPKPVWRRAWEAVEATAIGKNKSLAQCIDEAKKGFGSKGVTIDEICSALGVPSEKDITTDHVIVLAGMYSALDNGEATVDEMFRPTGGSKQKSEMADRYQPKKEPEKTKNTNSDDGNAKSLEQGAGEDTPLSTSAPALNISALESVRDELFAILDMEEYTTSDNPAGWAKKRAGSVLERLQGTVLASANPATHEAAKGIVDALHVIVDGEQTVEGANEFFKEMWGA